MNKTNSTITFVFAPARLIIPVRTNPDQAVFSVVAERTRDELDKQPGKPEAPRKVSAEKAGKAQEFENAARATVQPALTARGRKAV